MPPHYYALLFDLLAFALGASIGSFLNVCIYRLPIGLAVNEPERSFCPRCKTPIPLYHNVPILSWLLLRGKCASCGGGIAFRYIGVELLTGLLFLAVWRLYWPGAWLLAVPAWVFVSLCLVATFVDLEHTIIPDEITWGGTLAGLWLAYITPLAAGASATQATAALPGAALMLACLWIGWKAGGPFREMRAPGRLLGWSLAGVAVAQGVAAAIGAWPAFAALNASLLGAATGYFLLWGIVEAGKFFFGKRRLVFEKPLDFVWLRHGEDATFEVEGEPGEKWSELFARASDRLLIDAEEITIAGSPAKNCTAEFFHNRVRIGKREWLLDQIDAIHGRATALTIPREAMGFGDVKFMACVGAFLGWKAVLFTVMAGSTFGAIVGLTLIVIGRREWSAKIPFGPYLAVGALAWMFCGAQLVAWYLARLAPAGME